MSTHMMILSSGSKDLINQLIEEDIPTFVENAIDTIDRGENLESIPMYAGLLIEQLQAVDMMEVGRFFTKIIEHVENGLHEQAKVDLVLLKNYVGEIQVIYA